MRAYGTTHVGRRNWRDGFGEKWESSNGEVLGWRGILEGRGGEAWAKVLASAHWYRLDERRGGHGTGGNGLRCAE
jgi:hypothetical protein